MYDEKNKSKRPRVSIDGIKSSSSGKPSIGFDSNSPSSSSSMRRPQNIGDFKPGNSLSTSDANQTVFTPPPKISDKPKHEKSKLLSWRRNKKNGVDGIDHYDARKAKRKKRLKIAGIVVLILVVLFGFLAAKGYINLRKILGGGGSAAALNQDVDPSKLNVEGDGRINILLLGRGGEGHAGPDLTDTVILVSIDPIANEAGLVSIPRDTFVEIPGKGSMKINSVFSAGKSSALNNVANINSQSIAQAENQGLDLLQSTVQEVLGIPVHFRGVVDFAGFEKTIDTIGGIDFDAPERINEHMSINGQPYHLDVKKGYQHMDGFEALAYSRSRHASKRGDFDRSLRQRAIINATKDKILTAGTYSNPAKISQLLDNFGNNINTNFSLDDLTQLYAVIKQVDNSRIKSIGLADPPNNFLTTANIGGQSVVVPTAGIGNYSEIHSYIRNTLKDSFIKKENASILVLNGTSKAGLAKEKVDVLKSYGYNVIGSEDAPTFNYPRTMLIDLRGGEKKYTKHYLQRRLNVLAGNNLPDQAIQPGLADFVIIIGNDN